MQVLQVLLSKMSIYLNINKEDFFNAEFNITRTSSTLTATYAFSSRNLLQDSCNVSAINDIRSKLEGSAAELAFREALRPQFSLTSMSGESFRGPCSALSGRQPTLGVSIGTVRIIVGQYFSHRIPESAFTFSSGSNTRLSLEARFANNTRIPSNYWVSLSSRYLDANSFLQGIVTSETVASISSTSIKIVAITGLLEEMSQTVQLDVQPNTAKVSFYVTMRHSSSVSVSATSFLSSYLTFMSSYLAIPHSSFSIINYSTSSIKWTITSFPTQSCPTSQVQAVKEKLLDSDGTVLNELKLGLMRNLSIDVSTVEFKLAGYCDRPSVQINIPALTVPRYDSLTYQVPVGAFYDETDQGNLDIQLLQQDGSALEETSWIWYNNNTRTISGFPYSITNGTHIYMLKATDSEGQSVHQNISVLLSWSQPSYEFYYQLQFSFRLSLLPYSNVITTFIQSFKRYFNQPNARNLIVFRPIFLLNSKVRLYVQNTSSSSVRCDVLENRYILSRIQDSTDQTKPSEDFTRFMQNDFNLERLDAGETPACSVANRKPPYFNSLERSINDYYSTVKIVPYCSVSTFVIPANTFLDEEEGDTRNLKLSLANDNGQALPKNNWISLNSTSQTLYAVPTDNVFVQSSDMPYQYKLLATDSDSKSSSTSIRFNVVGPPPAGYYNITMTFQVSVDDEHVFQINSLFNSLKRIFADGPGIHVRSYSVQNTAGTFLASLVWSPCQTMNNACDTKTIEGIKAKLFSDGTGNISPNLRQAFDSNFQIVDVKESRHGPCSLEPPLINAKIPELLVSFCGPFSYQIPADAFVDQQDGDTRRLNLQLLRADAQAIASDFWLQFDARKQQITSVLAREQNATGFRREHEFILVATDSVGLSANTTIRVRITGSMRSYSHSFSTETVYSASASTHTIYEFSEKITNFIGVGLQIISHAKAPGNNFIVSWTNCSLRYEPCDVLGIKHIRDRMQAIDGSLQNAFTSSMGPEFTQIFLRETNFEPCQQNQPPMLAVPLATINVTTCETYTARIPEDTFLDKEQGNTRNLDLRMVENPYYWIQFDARQQELSILITTDIARNFASGFVTIAITATDLFQQVVRHDITIKIDRSRLLPNHKVSMQFFARSLEGNLNFVSMYDRMRREIAAYLSGRSAGMSLQFDKLAQQVPLNALLTAEWSSCSLSQEACEKSQINNLAALVSDNNLPSLLFKQALLPNFEVSTVNSTYQALCKDEVLQPIIQNQLPIINMSYCGYTIYQIPANTFYDKIDGDTRNLSLSILTESDQIAREPWFDFDRVQQSIRIVLSGDLFTNLATPAVFLYKLKATTKRGLSANANLRFRIAESKPLSSYTLKINFLWQQATPSNELSILATFMDRLSTYLARGPDDVYIISKSLLTMQVGKYFSISTANCSASYNPCDLAALNTLNEKVHDTTMILEPFRQAMGREMQISYVQIFPSGPCNQLNTPPRVKNTLPRLQVQTCSDFNYTIPSNTFFDEETSKLHLSVTAVNGIPVSGSYQWVAINPATGVLRGFVSDTVLVNKPASGYNLTIRGTDAGKLFAETYLILDVSGPVAQKLYQFTMILQPKQLAATPFQNEITVIRMLNRYFKTSFAHLMYAVISPETITARFSICTLPKKCDELLAQSYFRQITTPENTVPEDLASYFSPSYAISKTSVHRNPLCEAIINPPSPSRSTWTITASYCGGFRIPVPESMFSDKEDGNTRNLELDLRFNATHSVTQTYWVQLNKTTQELHGFPTREISLAPVPSIQLVARDSTGQEASVAINFAFTPHPEPKYIYKIVYQNTADEGFVDDVIAFSSKLRSFLNDSRSTSFGLINHSHPSNGAYFTEFANCSATYSPCDTHTLTSVKDKLFTVDYLPTGAFKQAMLPFVVSFGYVRVLEPCLGTLTHPPTVVSKITVLNIPLWSVFTYRIPAGTFYDTEDGDTRSLKLALADGENNAVGINSWLQLNPTKQTISSLGYASKALRQPPPGYAFILTATDSSQLSAADIFYAKIYGPAQILQDCQIQMVFTTRSTGSGSNELAINVTKTLARYLSLKTDNIGLVDFTRHSASRFSYSWGYVSSAYHFMTPATSADDVKVDYQGFVTDVLVKLFQADRRTVVSSLYSEFTFVSLQSVQTAFDGVCKNLPPVVTLPTKSLSLTVPFAGYRNEAIQKNWFYDFEDGDSYSLGLQLLSEANTTLNIDSWANIDTQSKALLFSLRDSQRYSRQVSYEYYLKATDSGGKTAVLPIRVTKLGAANTLSPINITFELTLNSFGVSELYVNQSIVISDKIAFLYSLSSGGDVITNQYRSSQYRSRVITWQPNFYTSCGSSTVLETTKQLLQPNSALLSQFRQHFLPQFNLQRAYYFSSCGPPGLAPSPTSENLEFNVTLCSPFDYMLPSNTFVDSVDGEISGMRVRLLDKDKRELPSNSWILLDSSSLRLFAIYQSSMLSTMTSSSPPSSTDKGFQSFEFSLEATNSRGLSSSKTVKVNVLDYPYTGECYTTIGVERALGPLEVPDLDVLYALVASISKYFGDPTTNVKVFKFSKQSRTSYQLIFSNCSIVFQTKTEAMGGVSESYRDLITSIFSRMVRADGTAEGPFESSLFSSGFRLQNISVSYNCIEAPPYSSVTERIRYAFFALPFNDLLPTGLFTDGRDGSSLKLSLHYENGTLVSLDEWLQINQLTRTIYGSVTLMQAAMTSYRYLLVATDSSYRTANISYVVRIANTAQEQKVSFYFGFSSSFTRFTSTARVLRNFTMKISKFIDNNDYGDYIIVNGYRSFSNSSSISFVDTQIQCDAASVTGIAQRLQRNAFKPEPSDAFKAAMGPEFTAQSIFVDGSECTGSTALQLTVNYQINVNVSSCGYMTYNVPVDVFSSSIGETTRDMLLTLTSLPESSKTLGSIIQFYRDSQSALIVPVFSKLSQSFAYKLEAKSPRSAVASASASLQFNFPDLKAVLSSKDEFCTITTNITTQYNPSVSETEILKTFVDKLTSYLGNSYQQLRVVSYERYWSLPVKMTIKFSKCSWAAMVQNPNEQNAYVQDVNAVTEKLFQKDGTTTEKSAKKEFVDSLEPDITVDSIEKDEKTCGGFPNKPPVGRAIDVITTPRCGEFSYRLLADLFSDEDGNTRNLTTQLLAEDGSQLPTNSWIVYDNITQTISGLPSRETFSNQGNSEYKYRIVATDKYGSSSNTTITVKATGPRFTSSYGLGIRLSFEMAMIKAYRTDLILEFTRKLSSYKLISDPYNRFLLQSVSVNGGQMDLFLVNCTLCSVDAANRYYAVSRSQADLELYMSPEFPKFYSIETSGTCDASDSGYNNVTSGTTQNITFCKRTSIDLLRGNGISTLPEDTKFIITKQNKDPLPLDSWFWLNESSSVLVAFPSEDIWQKQQQEGTPYLWSTAKKSTNVRIGSFIENRLHIAGIPPSTGLQYTINFESDGNQVDAYYINSIFDILTAYLGREDFQHISFQRFNSNIYAWKFLVCGLPVTCTDANVLSLNNKIYRNPNTLRAEFVEMFQNGIKVNYVNSSCNNNPPEILMPNLTLTIPACGLYRYKIPQDFAKDQEDGVADKLTLSLRMPNGDAIPRDSWVRLNETSREIYAFPLERISTRPQPSGWEFLMLVKDKDGGQAKTKLNIFVKRDTNTFYKLNFTIQTINQEPTKPFLDIQIELLTFISKFFFNSSLSQYRVLEFIRTATSGPKSEIFKIQFGNCSVTKLICSKDASELFKVQEMINSSYRDIDGRFRIQSVSYEPLYTVNTPPVVLNAMSDIRLRMCSKFVGDIPKSVFYDAELTEGDKLTIHVTFTNNSKVPRDHWVQAHNGDIYAVPYGDVNSGTYELKLTATDTCDQTTSTTFKVVLLQEAQSASIDFSMAVTPLYLKDMPAVYQVAKLKDNIESGLVDAASRPRVTYYQATGDVVKFRWLNCTTACNKTSNDELKAKVYDEAFRDSFSRNFTIMNITDRELRDCSKEGPVNQNISMKIGICEKLNFTVSLDRVFGTGIGDVSRFEIELLNESRQAVSKEDWLQYDSQKRAIYGYPRIPDVKNIKRINRYFLVARDQAGSTKTVNFTVEIVGNLASVTQRFTISSETKLKQETPLVAQEIALIDKIGSFFNNYEINSIAYSRNGDDAKFTWSFCNHAPNVCDCNRVRSARERLKNRDEFQQRIRPEFEVKDRISEEMLGACEEEKTPVMNEDRTKVIFQPGQYFSTEIKNSKFFDNEDGYTRNLTLYLASETSEVLDRSHWIKIQDYKICGLATLYESESMNRLISSTSVYKTIVQDRCGNEVEDWYNVTATDIRPRLRYKVMLHLNNSFGENCTKTRIFSQKISRYLQVPETDVFIYNYTKYNSTLNSTFVTWGLANITERNCTNNTLQELTEKMVFANGSVNNLFVEYMKSDYQVFFFQIIASSSLFIENSILTLVIEKTRKFDRVNLFFLKAFDRHLGCISFPLCQTKRFESLVLLM